MENSSSSHPSCREVIAIKSCTWHADCALLAIAKFCSDVMPYNGVTLRLIFHRTWIAMEKKNAHETGPSIPDGTRSTVIQMLLSFDRYVSQTDIARCRFVIVGSLWNLKWIKPAVSSIQLSNTNLNGYCFLFLPHNKWDTETRDTDSVNPVHFVTKIRFQQQPDRSHTFKSQKRDSISEYTMTLKTHMHLHISLLLTHTLYTHIHYIMWVFLMEIKSHYSICCPVHGVAWSAATSSVGIQRYRIMVTS